MNIPSINPAFSGLLVVKLTAPESKLDLRIPGVPLFNGISDGGDSLLLCYKPMNKDQEQEALKLLKEKKYNVQHLPKATPEDCWALKEKRTSITALRKKYSKKSEQTDEPKERLPAKYFRHWPEGKDETFPKPGYRRTADFPVYSVSFDTTGTGSSIDLKDPASVLVEGTKE